MSRPAASWPASGGGSGVFFWVGGFLLLQAERQRKSWKGIPDCGTFTVQLGKLRPARGQLPKFTEREKESRVVCLDF